VRAPVFRAPSPAIICRYSPLLTAFLQGHVECARLLLQHGASVNAQNSADGDTPLHRAVREGHVECVKLLLEVSLLFVNAQNSADGDTPLHRAVCEGHVECVKLLLEKRKTMSALTHYG